MKDETVDAAHRTILQEHDLSAEGQLSDAHRTFVDATNMFVDFFKKKYPGKNYFHFKQELEHGSFKEVSLRIKDEHTQLSVDTQSKEPGKILSSAYATALLYPEKTIFNLDMSGNNREKEDRMHSQQNTGEELILVKRGIGGGISDREMLQETNNIVKLLNSIMQDPGAFNPEVLDEPPALYGLGYNRRFPVDNQERMTPYN